jgi:hypothetical protein
MWFLWLRINSDYFPNGDALCFLWMSKLIFKHYLDHASIMTWICTLIIHMIERRVQKMHTTLYTNLLDEFKFKLFLTHRFHGSREHTRISAEWCRLLVRQRWRVLMKTPRTSEFCDTDFCYDPFYTPSARGAILIQSHFPSDSSSTDKHCKASVNWVKN